MSRPLQQRYPFADLRDVVDPRHERTNLEVAEMLGLHPRQLERYRRQAVSGAVGNALAVRAGTHPAVIWPEWSCAGAA